MVELADTTDLKSVGFTTVPVRVWLAAPFFIEVNIMLKLNSSIEQATPLIVPFIQSNKYESQVWLRPKDIYDIVYLNSYFKHCNRYNNFNNDMINQWIYVSFNEVTHKVSKIILFKEFVKVLYCYAVYLGQSLPDFESFKIDHS